MTKPDTDLKQLQNYAVVEVGGKQYRVEKGQSLLVDRLPGEAGSKVSLKPLLYRPQKGETKFLSKDIDSIKVDAKIVRHLRGDKIRVFKFKPKRGYRRQAGHRSELTELEIADIKVGSAQKPAPKKPESAPKSSAEPAKKHVSSVKKPTPKTAAKSQAIDKTQGGES